jgi:hypothetical protein
MFALHKTATLGRLLRLSPSSINNNLKTTKISKSILGGARFSSETPISDRDLQIEFSTVGAKLELVLSLLLRVEERKKFAALQNKNIIGTENILENGAVYVCLQNPLLKRYDFDPAEFLEGAKFGFEAVYSAIASKDFFEFCNKTVENSESHELLSSTLSPTLYDACVRAQKLLHSQGAAVTLKELSIPRFHISAVFTSIAAGDVPPGTEYMRDRERMLYLEAQKTMNTFLKEKGNEGNELSSTTTDADGANSVAGESNPTDAPSRITNQNRAFESVEAESECKSSAASHLPGSKPADLPCNAATPSATSCSAAIAVAPAESATASGSLPSSSLPSQAQPKPGAVVTGEQQRFEVKPATRQAPSSAKKSFSELNIKNNGIIAEAKSVNASSDSAKGSEKSKVSESGEQQQQQQLSQGDQGDQGEGGQGGPTPPTSAGAPGGVAKIAEGSKDSSSTSSSTSTDGDFDEQEASAEREKEAEIARRLAQSLEVDSFPPGSVVASVEVHFESQEVYHRDILGLQGPLSSVTEARVDKHRWLFRGCISGQEPLEWKIVAFDGVGGQQMRR